MNAPTRPLQTGAHPPASQGGRWLHAPPEEWPEDLRARGSGASASCGSSRSTHTVRLWEHSWTFSRDLLHPSSVHPKSTQSLLFSPPLCPFLLLSILPLPLTNFSSPILGGVGKSTCPVWAGPGGPHSTFSVKLKLPHAW